MEEMSDINEFMSHFGNGFELKWGLALDPDLDKRVKVTILATGFGIKDVEGMGSHIKKQSLEEAARLAEQEEHQNDIRRPQSALLWWKQVGKVETTPTHISFLSRRFG